MGLCLGVVCFVCCICIVRGVCCLGCFERRLRDSMITLWLGVVALFVLALEGFCRFEFSLVLFCILVVCFVTKVVWGVTCWEVF